MTLCCQLSTTQALMHIRVCYRTAHVLLDVSGERLNGIRLDIVVEVLLRLPLLVRVQEQIV